MEKFKKLLEHWIEHNEEHIENYMKWAEELGGNVSDLLKEAVKKFEEGNEILKRIFRELNG